MLNFWYSHSGGLVYGLTVEEEFAMIMKKIVLLSGLTLLITVATCPMSHAAQESGTNLASPYELWGNPALPVIVPFSLKHDQSFAADLTKVRAIGLQMEAERAQAKAKLAALLATHHFAELEQLVGTYRAQKTVLPGGRPYLDFFYSSLCSRGIERPLTGPESFSEIIAAWVKQYPHSITPYTLLAIYYMKIGSEHRGNRIISEVSEEQLKLFTEYFEKAAQTLLTIPKQATPDAEYYRALIALAPASLFDTAQQAAFLKQGLAVDADYLPLYSELAYYLMPRWGGKVGEFKKYIEWASDNRLKHVDADIVYSSLALSVAGFEDADTYKTYNLSWLRTQLGFKKMAQAGLVTPEQLHRFCWVAKVLGDIGVTRVTMDAIGQAPSDWESNHALYKRYWADDRTYYNQAWAWAHQIN